MTELVIIGGGPSGMAAAYEAVGAGASAIVLERNDRVGGLARTLDFQGSRFDIGPHRFFTRNREVEALFVKLVAEDLVTVSRLTRIFYNNKYFNYPLTPLNALFGVGLLPSAQILTSYAAARARRLAGIGEMVSFEDWTVDRFGRRLFEAFFKTYTEKVWGVSCREIGADWAGQRIKGLSLSKAVANALFKPKDAVAKTLIDEFIYPRRGAGQFYEKMADAVTARGGQVELNAAAMQIRRDNMRVRAVVTTDGREIAGRFFLASAPLTDIVRMMTPAPPADVLAACAALRYRNHVGVNLLVEGVPFPDNWIYVHSRAVGMARIANYRNFSAEMSSDPGISPMTVEYFCFPGDAVWEAQDASLLRRAERELRQMEILRGDRVIGGFVARSEQAHPVIEIGYGKHLAIIKAWLDRLENLLPIGRSGMFKYNNQDHAIATGLLAARTALGTGHFDPWRINIDAEYHEAGAAYSSPQAAPA
jgi:protoporphyrinogen oxidase